MVMDVVELVLEVCFDIVVLVIGDFDFVYLVEKFRRRGIWVEVVFVE